MGQRSATYDPLGCPKPFAGNVWIVDGPAIRFGPALFKMPFPTRMTILRLGDGRLLVHSPTALSPALKRRVDGLGRVAFIVGPNRIHYWWIPDWRQAYPEAEIWLAPRIREQAGGRIDFVAEELGGQRNYPWDGEVETLAVEGSYMSEYVFFHRQSRTLVLTDVIENFERKRLGPLMRVLTWLGGVQDPHGSMPRDMRLTYRRDGLRAAIGRMLAWEPERIIIAHGRCYDRDGAAELARAFRWVLD